MSVTHLRYVALSVPPADTDSALAFYHAFGLQSNKLDGVINLTCADTNETALKLISGGDKKRLQYVALGTTEAGLEAVKARLQSMDIPLESAGCCEVEHGICFRDPCGIQYNVSICARPQPLAALPAVQMNTPGNTVRTNEGVLPPKSQIGPVKPLRLGHCLLFSPNVTQSVAFVETVLGMHLSDRAEDVVAFTHCDGGSDHHVIAFAKSAGIGFHHASFEVATPDDVGLGDSKMAVQGYEQGWGFGRHSIGSNFFYYVRDPWGSYLEYYCDMDYIADSAAWQPTNWPLEDSLHSWGPNPPADFVHNYEV